MRLEFVRDARSRDAVTLICVGLVTANGGTTTVSPALGKDSTPPNGPMVAEAVTADASGVFRSSGVTVVGCCQERPQKRLRSR